MTPAAIQRRKTEFMNHIKKDDLKMNSYNRQLEKEKDDTIDDGVFKRI